MEPEHQKEQQQASEASVERIPVRVVTQTDEVNFNVKITYQVIITTYADGSTQQTRHSQSDARVTVDREDVTDTYANPI